METRSMVFWYLQSPVCIYGVNYGGVMANYFEMAVVNLINVYFDLVRIYISMNLGWVKSDFLKTPEIYGDVLHTYPITLLSTREKTL